MIFLSFVKKINLFYIIKVLLDLMCKLFEIMNMDYLQNANDSYILFWQNDLDWFHTFSCVPFQHFQKFWGQMGR